jgi:nitroreductase
MYAQRLLLSLAACGIGSIPQTSLGFFADVVGEVLGVSAEFKLLLGISFGYHDDASKGNTERLDRALLTDSVTLHR